MEFRDDGRLRKAGIYSWAPYKLAMSVRWEIRADSMSSREAIAGIFEVEERQTGVETEHIAELKENFDVHSTTIIRLIY